MATDKKDYTQGDRVKALQNQGMSERDAILVSMKKTKAEKKKSSAMVLPSDGGDPYPYGLTLSLEDDSLTKLGLDKLPGVGDEFMLHGKAKVESVSQNESNGSKSRSVRLQITDLCVEDESAETPDEEAAEDEDEEAGE